MPVSKENMLDQIYLVQRIYDPQDQYKFENELKVEKDVEYYQTNKIYALKTTVSNFSASYLNI